MTRSSVAHIVVVNHSRSAANDDVAFWTEAARLQLEDVARVWGLPPPGIFFAGSQTETPATECGVIGIVDDDGNADSAGYHSVVGRLNFGLVDMSQALIPSRTLSHEAIELIVNPKLDWWVPDPTGRLIAVEACDPVQRSDYEMLVDVMGFLKTVVVSNWVTPAWFGLQKGSRMDWLTRLLSPFQLELGGYAIAQENGKIVHLGDSAAAERKPPLSRTARTAPF